MWGHAALSCCGGFVGDDDELNINSATEGQPLSVCGARQKGRALNEQGWRFWMIVGAFINKGEPPRSFPALDYFPLVVN